LKGKERASESERKESLKREIWGNFRKGKEAVTRVTHEKRAQNFAEKFYPLKNNTAAAPFTL